MSTSLKTVLSITDYNGASVAFETLERWEDPNNSGPEPVLRIGVDIIDPATNTPDVKWVYVTLSDFASLRAFEEGEIDANGWKPVAAYPPEDVLQPYSKGDVEATQKMLSRLSEQDRTEPGEPHIPLKISDWAMVTTHGHPLSGVIGQIIGSNQPGQFNLAVPSEVGFPVIWPVEASELVWQSTHGTGPMITGQAPPSTAVENAVEPSATIARQCAVIYNGIQCTKPDGHGTGHQFELDWTSVQPGPAEGDTAVPTDGDDKPKRARRKKEEKAYDDALEAHQAAPDDATWAALVEAEAALRKRLPDNPRLAGSLNALQNTDAEPTPAEAAQYGPQFAPEPTPAPNYLAQESHPANQQFAEAAAALPGVHLQDSVTMTPEQFQQSVSDGNPAAALAQCAHVSESGRQCNQHAGHEAQRPHTYPELSAAPEPIGVPTQAWTPAVPPAGPVLQVVAPAYPGAQPSA